MSSSLSPSDYLWRSLSQLRGLTVVRFLSKLNSPKSRGVAVAYTVAHMVKRTVFLVSAKVRFKGAVQIGGATSSIREDWRPLDGRGALLRLFLFLPTNVEVSHV